MSDWKPGDVAIVSFGDTGPYRAFWDSYNEVWVSDKGGRLYPDPDRDVVAVRPLVVIDPESAEDVKRLVTLYNLGDCEDEWVAGMQAALREFAAPTPPKPAEPTGLGAVVIDARGFCWVKVDTAMNCDSWTQADAGMAGADTWRKYVGLNAVRVLSEGIQ